MSFTIELSSQVICLLSVSAFCTAIIIALYCPFVRKVASRRKACELMSDDLPDDGNMRTAVSVIVYSHDEADRLESFLPIILNQDYPAAFEVIVVNEGDSGEIRNIINALQLAHRNLYLTFTPDGARNLSRKKLALTLGIKAARYDTVVLTTVDAIIDSDKWLAKMMRHFANPSTGIVLGFAAPAEQVSRTSSFAFSADSVQWLSSAICHRPFRGTELNLAYRRKLFFDNKGFSRSLNLHFGDDDIFISEIATRSNTVVELSPESIVRFQSYDNAKTMRDTAIRHIFTGRFLKRKPIPALSIGEWAMWVGLASTATCIFSDPANGVVVGAEALLLIASFIEIARSWRKATAALTLRRITLTAPFLALIRPFSRLVLSLRASISRQKKYTWD